MSTIRSALPFTMILATLAACTPATGTDAGVDVTQADVASDVAPDVRPDVPRDVRLTGCRAATNCAACSAMNTSSISCGWSISASACLDADSADPTQSADGSSTGNDWAPLSGLCPGSTECQALTDCVACDTSGAGCGWCSAGNRCLPGIASTGSQDGTCMAANWVQRASYCPNANAFCGSHSSTCDDCTNTPFCGMCAGTHTCRPGTMTGPLNGMTQEMCTGSWAWLPSDCTGFDAGVATDASPTDASGTDSAPTDAPTDVPTDAPTDAPGDVVSTDATAE